MTTERRSESVELPASTSWPLVLATGMAMLAAGLVTSPAFLVVGGGLLVLALAGWIGQLLPGRGHVHEPPADLRPTPIEATVGTVDQLRPGMPGYRLRLPEKVHPISAGVKGGILGGLLMPIPAFIYGVQSGHGIWFPINLLAGMVLPNLVDPNAPAEQQIAQLEQFSLTCLVLGVVIHAVISVVLGLLYGVLLPTLPDVPGGQIVWGGVLLPLLWTGASYGLMGVINPVLERHVAWPWFILSQFVYGVTAAVVVILTEKVQVPPAGRGAPAVALTLLALLLAGCDDAPGRPNPARRPVLPSQVMDFDTLYRNNCAGCHGRDGNLGPAPPLADPLFLAIVSDAELLRVVTEGRSGTQMPAFAQSHGGTLTAAQVKVLVEGVRTKWGASGRSAESVPPYLLEHTAAGTLAGNSKEGAKVFADACAGCHGAGGKGGEAAGSIRDPAFLETVSKQVLRRYVITGRHDLGMPDYADPEGRSEGFKPLTPRQVTDLVALLAEWKDGGK